MAFDRSTDWPRGEDFREAFAASGFGQPLIIWAPGTRDIRRPELRAIAQDCLSIQSAEGKISEAAFARFDLGGLADHLALASPLGNGTGFRFDAFGSGLHSSRSRDLTGLSVDALDPPISTLVNAIFDTARRSGAMAFSVHEPSRGVFARTRSSLTVPLSDADGRASRIAMITMEDNDLRPGLDALPDPVFVIRPDQSLAFANAAATTLFGALPIPQRETLVSYCGIALDLHEADGASHVTHHESRAATVCDRLVVHFQITARQLLFREALYYIVVLRPE